MSLYGRLAEINCPVFLNTNRWATTVTFVPASNYANRVENVEAVVFEDALPGTNENPGDGRNLNRPATRRTRESIMLYVDACLSVQRTQPISSPDAFIIDGDIYAVKRIVGADPAGMELLCVRTETNTLRNYERVG